MSDLALFARRTNGWESIAIERLDINGSRNVHGRQLLKHKGLLDGALIAFKFGLVVALFPSVGHAEVLEQLISSALSSHPSAQVQRALEESARSGVDSANWQFFPTPSVVVEKAQALPTDPSYRGDGVVSTLRLRQLLWTGGRLTAGVDKAEAGLIVSRAAHDEVRQQLALRVVQAYGDWLAAYLKTQAYDKSLATHTRLREQVKRRIDQGISAESDLILAHGHLKSVAADLALSRAQGEIALARLGQLVGHPVDGAELGATVSASRPVNFDLQELLDLALAANPRILKARAQARMNEAEIDERRADLSPEVYVNAERQYGNFSILNTPPASRLFIGFSSRFGAGLSSLSNVEGAKLQHKAALADVEAQNRSVREEVLADYALAVTSKSRQEAARASLDSAQQVSESYGRQFLAGKKSWQDVMNAARELTQIEVQLADILSNQVVVTWRLSIYTGGVSLSDLSRRDAGARDQAIAATQGQGQQGQGPALPAAADVPLSPPVASVSPEPAAAGDATGAVEAVRFRFVEGRRGLVAAEKLAFEDSGALVGPEGTEDRATKAVRLQSAHAIKLPLAIKHVPVLRPKVSKGASTLQPPKAKKHRAIGKPARTSLKAHGRRKK